MDIKYKKDTKQLEINSESIDAYNFLGTLVLILGDDFVELMRRTALARLNGAILVDDWEMLPKLTNYNRYFLTGIQMLVKQLRMNREALGIEEEFTNTNTDALKLEIL